jgi:YfiH family protein
MNEPRWLLQGADDCRFFELQDSSYSMRFTIRDFDDRCIDVIKPVLLTQIHSATIIDVDNDATRNGDGLCSSHMHSALGIKVADCLPVYLYNDTMICIIHCGWRGIAAGIARYARQYMGTFSYALGACIGPECYEVQQDVVDQFKIRYASALLRKDGAYRLDLKKAVIQDLGNASLVASLDYCTKCHPEYFYSFRRGDRKKRNYAIITKK